MEELIRWIIIIVIFYSFIKGLFPKKKTDADKSSTSGNIPGKETLSSGSTVPPQRAKRPQDLTLEDILTGTPIKKPTEQEPLATSGNAETYSYTDKYSENNPFDSPVDYDRGQNVSRETIITAKLKEKAAKDKKGKRELSKDTLVFRSEKVQDIRELNITSDLKSKLKQAETLREMFIISEILGKPKALRKW